MTNPVHCLRQHREIRSEIGMFDSLVGGERADMESIRDAANVGEDLDVRDVDQVHGTGEPKGHHRDHRKPCVGRRRIDVGR
jgi:hypothetical protein